MKVGYVPGDGVGPEVLSVARAVVDATGVGVEWLDAEAGLACHARTGAWLPEATLAACREADAVLFGAITSPLGDATYRSPILALRLALDLYANVRPARDWGQPCLQPGIDLVVVRENTEGMYNAPEDEDVDGVTTRRRVTRRGCERIVRAALDVAAARPAKRVLCAHKANVLRRSDQLFLDAFRAEADRRPDLRASDGLIDSVAMDVVRSPSRFDTIVTLNLYGDVLSDVAAGVAGGLGFAPSGSYGPRHALFEPVHGSAPDIAGKGVANPCAAVLSAAMMLRHLGRAKEADRVEAAVRVALAQGRTADAGGSLGTRAFERLVLAGVA
ncbi:MAG TPA: isocitrate/isopropylmalate dehydrogenase family protein [Candidatus Thermoplasmatota archaeon]|nr:isocitrate/isopropylmalate dehydrogenase family protein [Candidatus Thermoplasmatota archaeon]